MINKIKIIKMIWFQYVNKQEKVEENSDDDDLQFIISTSQKLSTFLIDKNYIRAKKWDKH
jgi:hypothetical protein